MQAKQLKITVASLEHVAVAVSQFLYLYVPLPCSLIGSVEINGDGRIGVVEVIGVRAAFAASIPPLLISGEAPPGEIALIIGPSTFS